MVDIKALFEQMKANNLQVVELIENSDVARSVDNFEAADAYLNGAVSSEVPSHVRRKAQRIIQRAERKANKGLQ